MDECLPRLLKRQVVADVVKTVPEMGWASKKNGELLRLAQREFDVPLTNDQNLEHQQNLKKYDLAFAVLIADTNDIADLKPLMPAANKAMAILKEGEIVYVRDVAE